MIPLLHVFAAAALAAPRLDSGPRLAALKASAAAEIAAVNWVLQLPVEPSKAAAIREAADAVVKEAGSCAEAAGALDSLLVEPREFLEGQLRGEESLDRRGAALGPARDRSASRLAAARSGVEALKKAAEDEKDPKKKKRLEALLEEAEAALRKAEQAQASVPAAAAAADDARQEARSKVRRALSAVSDYSSLSAELRAIPPTMAEPAAALKARADALGQEPETENRTRFYQALNPLLDPARTVYARSNSAADRFERAASEHSKAGVSVKLFDESLALAEKRQADAEAALTAVEAVLQRR